MQAGNGAPVRDIVHITLVGTSDLHGWLEPHEAERPGDPPTVGGIATFGGYVNVLRAQRPDSVVLVDAGDLFQGTLISNMSEGAAVVKAYNALRYDAVAVGNHEFDYGPEGDSSVARTPSEDPLGALKARMRDAEFPFLAGNIVTKTGGPVTWAARRSTLIHRQGLTIGIIGLTTPTTPSVTLAVNVAALDFKPLLASTKELAAELRDHGAQIVILAVHAGGSCPRGQDPHSLSNCDGGEIVPFLNELPPGTVDAVIAGHTHQFMSNFVNGVPVIESKAYGEAFGIVDLAYDRTAGKLDPSQTVIWPTVSVCRLVHADTNSCATGTGPLVPPKFLGALIVEDPAVAAAIHSDSERVSAQRSEIVGPVLEQPYTRSRTQESDLGDLVAEVTRLVIPGAKVGVVNSGGLRDDIAAGPITYGRVFNAIPFENRVASIQMTGGQLLALLAKGLSGEHGILQVSGVRIEAVAPGEKPCDPNGSRLLNATFEDGSPIIPNQTYTLATNDFLATGGDGFDVITRQIDQNSIVIHYELPPLREQLVAYLRFHPELKQPVKPEKPRIAFVKPVCTASTSAP
jgi:5'-nucleotidase